MSGAGNRRRRLDFDGRQPLPNYRNERCTEGPPQGGPFFFYLARNDNTFSLSASASRAFRERFRAQKLRLILAEDQMRAVLQAFLTQVCFRGPG